jgi:hypothetical protein
MIRRNIIAAAVLLPLMACGGTSTGPSPNEVSAGSMAITSGEFIVTSFNLDARAPLHVQVDWSNTSNDLDAFLIRGTCSRDDVLTAKPACTMDAVFVGAGTGTTKPETFTTAAVEAGAYTLLVVNRGAGNDSCNFKVTKAN